MPFRFNQSIANVVFKNKYQNQEVRLGFRDQNTYHYHSIALSQPLLDSLNWPHIGSGLVLYQKTSTYNSVDDFLKNPPKDKVIGTYDYDANSLSHNVSVPNYQPSQQQTVIDTPLRGKVTMYVYLNKEPFSMTVQKRDLNWYDDPDVTDIKIYKDKDVVLEDSIDDDGNSGHDHKVGVTGEVTLKNPGPGLPEPGVYKVEIDAPDDSVITRISTNLHKIVLAGPIYPVSNHEVYGGLVDQTSPNTIYTNALNLTAQTSHQALQALTVDKQALPLTQAGVPATTTLAGGTHQVVVPKSDVILNGIGYFSFTQDQFFEPTPYHLLPISDASDLAQVDYVLTNYQAPRQLGDGWLEATRQFDLSTAVVQKGKLSWVIQAPGLSDNHRTIEIKSISMTLTKKGWLKQ